MRRIRQRLLTGLVTMFCSTGLVAAAPNWALNIIEKGEPACTHHSADGIRLFQFGSIEYYIASWETSNEARVYERVSGKWALKANVPLPSGANPEDSLLAYDLCDQGTPDAVITGAGGVYLQCHSLEAKTNAVLFPHVPTADSPDWMYSMTMDVDGDGDLDIVSGSTCGTPSRGCSEMGWLANPLPTLDPSDAANWNWHTIISERNGGPGINIIMTLMAANMDGDSDLDVFYSDRSNVGYVENQVNDADEEDEKDPTAESNWVRTVIGNSGGKNYMFSDLADLSAGGRDEVITITRPPGTNSEIVYFEYDAGTSSWIEHNFLLPPGVSAKGKAIKAGDIDNDGDLDLVTAYVEADGTHGIVWHKNDGSLTIDQWSFDSISGSTARVLGPTYVMGDGIKFDDLLLHDVDGDGDKDVLTTEEHEGPSSTNLDSNCGMGVLHYENPL